MRRLQFGDIFRMSKVASRLNIKIDSKGKDPEDFGKELMFKVAENLHLAEQECLELFASLKGMSVEEVSHLPLMQLIDEFKEVDGIKVFFQQISRSMQ